jgi:hypothetical protein
MRKEKTDRDPDLEVSGHGHRSGGLRNTQVRSGLRSGVPEKCWSGPGLRSGGPRDLRSDLWPGRWRPLWNPGFTARSYSYSNSTSVCPPPSYRGVPGPEKKNLRFPKRVLPNQGMPGQLRTLLPGRRDKVRQVVWYGLWSSMWETTHCWAPWCTGLRREKETEQTYTLLRTSALIVYNYTHTLFNFYFQLSDNFHLWFFWNNELCLSVTR